VLQIADSEQLPYSPGLIPGEEGGGANVNMAGVSVRSRDIPDLRFPGAIRTLVAVLSTAISLGRVGGFTSEIDTIARRVALWMR
jgi:hypothetical protein